MHKKQPAARGKLNDYILAEAAEINTSDAEKLYSNTKRMKAFRPKPGQNHQGNFDLLITLERGRRRGRGRGRGHTHTRQANSSIIIIAVSWSEMEQELAALKEYTKWEHDNYNNRLVKEDRKDLRKVRNQTAVGKSQPVNHHFKRLTDVQSTAGIFSLLFKSFLVVKDTQRVKTQ